MNRKGMSQTLALIVAASVLMMTALTVIAMTSDSLFQTDQGLTASGCTTTINNACRTSSTVLLPGSCFNQDGSPVANTPVTSDMSPGTREECSTLGY